MRHILLILTLLLPTLASAQSSTIFTRGATGIPGWKGPVTVPYDENNGIVCDETTTPWFECETVGGPLRGELVEDFNGEALAVDQNFNTMICGATLDCEQDAAPEKFSVETSYGDRTAEELFDDEGVFSITHPPHVYEFLVNDYDLDTTGARLVHRAARNVLTLEATDAGGQAEAAERADWDCPQVQFICWHSYSSAGASDSSGPPSTSTPDISVYVNGSDSSIKLADITNGAATGCDRTIPTYGWQEDDLIALKIACASCSDNETMDFYVRVGCY